jgi:phospholipid-binding lipoprotein MlaA
VSNIDLRNSLYGLEAVIRREALLDISNVIDRTAIDRYSFIRDAYLKRRSAQVRGPGAEAEALPNYEDVETETTNKK